MHLHGPEVLAALPVPEPHPALCITRGQELSIWAEVESTSVARVDVASKLLLAIHLEVAFAIIDHYFIVHGLAREVLAVRVHGGCRDGLHIRLRDVLCDHRYAELP